MPNLLLIYIPRVVQSIAVHIVAEYRSSTGGGGNETQGRLREAESFVEATKPGQLPMKFHLRVVNGYMTVNGHRRCRLLSSVKSFP